MVLNENLENWPIGVSSSFRTLRCDVRAWNPRSSNGTTMGNLPAILEPPKEACSDWQDSAWGTG